MITKKNYQIFLCESVYRDDVLHLNDVRVCELGSSTLDFSGKAFNIEFYSKIDGTHELSFDLPSTYFDVDAGKTVDNELVKLVSNKCKIELIVEDKTYFMVINNCVDKEEKGGMISRSYSCTDAFIEELSKTGYGIVFSDEVEGNGLGTIHELAEQVVAGTEWMYDKDKTGTLYEYKKELRYNVEQGRYDEVHTPMPVHKVKYIPELKRYCNELKLFKEKKHYETITEQYYVGDVAGDELFGFPLNEPDNAITKKDAEAFENIDTLETSSNSYRADMNDDGKVSTIDQRKFFQFLDDNGITDWSSSTNSWELSGDKISSLKRTRTYTELKERYHRIYCYEDSEQITSNTVQNYLSNANDFIDYVGWQTYGLDDSNLIVSGAILASEKDNDKYLLKVSPIAGQLTTYLLNDTIVAANKFIQGSSLYAFKWVAGTDNKAEITKIKIYGKNPLTNEGIKPDYELKLGDNVNFTPGIYYTIKPKTSISNPYVVFEINCKEGEFFAESFLFFPIKGKKTSDTIDNSEINNLDLLSRLTDGTLIGEDDLKIMQLPSDAPSAYTHKQVRYFIRDNYEVTEEGIEQQVVNDSEKDTVTYLDFETEVNSSNNYVLENRSFKDFSPKEIISKDNLPEEPDIEKVYKLTTNGKYYQYYTITIEDNINGAWDYALYDEGANDKRRTLSVERSNRFNIIQNLAELFKVWPVFEMKRNSEGIIEKKFWFREKCIRENFSGFHKGINLTSLSRTINSDEIVTKMYVEDINCDFTDDGFVTIRKSPLNPWGENYYYNFQYYVNQKLINATIEKGGVPMPIVQYDIDELYTKVKGINDTIFDLNDKVSNAKVELTNLHARLTSLATSIAAMVERTTSLGADLETYKDTMAEPDQQKIQNNLSNYEKQKKKYEDEKSVTQAEYDQLEKEIKDWQEELSNLMTEKKDAINKFENKYSQFIKEGVWTDSSYVDNNTYYLDSLDVMNTSSMPKVDWSIEVVDASLGEDFDVFKFEVGDQTFVVDDEFFMKDPKQVYKFEVLISGIKDYLDMPTKNVIEVRNYRTSFEDIFQRISAATQTLELKEQTYDKAANFTNNGQVDQSIIQNTLLNNALILANATDNSYVLDNTGLHLQSVINPSKKLRAIADGIFISNSVDSKGQPKWMTGITADGINASVLTSGEVNTSVIKIYSKGTPSFSWNELGISAYKYREGKVDSNSFMRFDSFGLYSVDNFEENVYFNYDGNGKPWFEGLPSREDATKQILNNSVVSITDKGFNLNVKNGKGSIRLGYGDEEDGSLFSEKYGLYIKDTEGNFAVQLQNNGDNQIAGWKIDHRGLYYGGDTKKSYTYDNSPVGMSPANEQYAFWAGYDVGTNTAKFYVEHDGTLHAIGADIEGKITVGVGANIAGWSIDKYGFYKSTPNTKINDKNVYYTTAMYANESIGSTSKAFHVYEHDNGQNKNTDMFYVQYNGKLYAKNANIEGEIKATKGNFSDSVTIGGTKVTTGYLRDLYNYATSGVNNEGITINYINATGGKVGGWNINRDKLQIGDVPTWYGSSGTPGERFLELSSSGLRVGHTQLRNKNVEIDVTIETTLQAIQDGKTYTFNNVPCIRFRQENYSYFLFSTETAVDGWQPGLHIYTTKPGGTSLYSILYWNS